MIYYNQKFATWYVSSSNIHHVTYLKTYQTLTVYFLNGSVYKYYRVPENIYKELIAAKSKGSYFYWNIRNYPPYGGMDSLRDDEFPYVQVG